MQKYPHPRQDPQNNLDEMSLRGRSPKQSTHNGIASLHPAQGRLPPPASRDDDGSSIALDLAPEEAALAQELILLSEATARARISWPAWRGAGPQAPGRLPRLANHPTLAVRLRGYCTPPGAGRCPPGVILLILVISLLLQVRPRQTASSVEITATHPPTEIVTQRPKPTPATSYRVQEGDTLIGIAAHFGVTEEDILELNNLQPGDPLRVGQLLYIRPEVRATSTPVTSYRVQESDTLIGIAAYFGVTVEALLEANNLQSGDAISVGQSLVIPLSSRPF